MRKIFTLAALVLPLLFAFQSQLNAQCNTAPCSMPMPSVNAMDACVLPSPSALDCYYGSTTDDAPQSFPPSWCTTIENNHWFAFTADATTATFDISVYGCASGNGLQAAVLSTADCISFDFVSPCLGNIPTQTTSSLTATGLVPGEVYYLMLDGSGGSLCDYAINGSVPTVNGPTSGVCVPSSPNGTYTVTTPSTWQIVPPTAGNFIGPSNGTTVNVQWLEPGPAQICAKSIQCPDAPEFCLDVNIGEDISTIEYVDVCQGYTTTCAGQTFSAPGSFLVNLPTYLNCDSLITCVVNLIPTVRVTETVWMCQGGSVTCAGEEFFNPGSFPVMFTNYQGCDSIVTCKVNMIPTYFGPMQLINICGPAEYQVCDNILTSSGIYQETCTSYLGCDSIVNINLAILEPVAIVAPPDTLDCDNNVTVTLNGSASPVNGAVGGTTLYKWTGPGIVGFSNQPTCVVNQPGTYCLVVTHSRGGLACSDTTCVDVFAISAVPQLPLISGNPIPCGDSTEVYTATAAGLPTPTSFVWTTPGNVPFTSTGLNSIQITWNSVVSGLLCVTANNSCGASQPACQNITVQPPIQQPVLSGPNVVCAGGGNYTFTLNLQQIGVNYNWTVPAGAVLSGSGDTVQVNFLNAVSGQVCVTPQNACGTGAPVCQNVQVQPIPTADLSQDAQLCAGESVNLNFNLTGNGPFDVTWLVNNQPFTLNDIPNGHSITVTPAQTTTYKLQTISDNSTPACSAPLTDSVVVTVHPNFSITQTAQICDGESFFVGGAAQTQSGVYTDSLNSIFGCDSIITTTLTVFTIDTTILNTNTCDPALAGFSVQTLTQLNGCDSVVISTVTLLPSDTTLIFDNSCDINNVGVFTQNLFNVYGCDSTVITTVSFALSDTTYVSAASCDPAATGVFYDNLLTTDGCDSLIITTVSLLPASATQLSGTTCNPAEVGVFVNVLPNQFGCDSTITTTITLVPLDTTFLTATSCDPAQVGVFANTLITSGGCDSVIVTTVSLLPSSATQLSGTTCNPAEVGVFVDILPNQFGCDSTITTTVTFVPIDTTFLTGATCDPTLAGVFAETIVTPAGCDSILVTTVSLLPSHQIAVQTFTCDPTLAGVFTYPLINQFGCDSTVTETRTLLPSSATTINLTTCDPAEVGTDIDVVPNQFGCDSTITTITTLLPANSCSVVGTLVGANIPCGLTTGALTLTMTVGTAPFDYTVLQGNTVVANGTVTSLNTPQAIAGLSAGNYTVNITSPNGYSTSAQATLVQLVPPALSAIAAANYSGYDVSCTGATDGAAQAVASGGLLPYQFAWSNGGTTQQINSLTAGVYSVTITDANACTNVATVALDEPQPLALTFTVNDLDCFGQNDGAITVGASGGAAPYRYSVNDGPTQTSNAFLGLTSGAYVITASDANDCSQTEIIVVNAAVPVDVELGENITIGQGDEAVIEAVVNVPIDSILSVVWTPPFIDSECPDCLTQVVTPLVSTVYSIAVEALNGCVDEDKVTVIVDRRRQVYIPNVFSPNLDGANDLFSVYAKPGTVLKVNSLQVFDRWGNALFQMEDFQPNNPTIGWDGTYKGQPMNPGVFVYVAEIEFIDGEKTIFKGDVTIVR